MKRHACPPSLHPTYRPPAIALWVTGPALRWVMLLALCAAYIQGGLVKAFDFPGATAEMLHFGIEPAAPMALLTIVVELGASAMVLSGRWRWLGALALAGFTFMANFVANRFWDVPAAERAMLANGFFEHIGLVGGLCLVAWMDLRERLQA